MILMRILGSTRSASGAALSIVVVGMAVVVPGAHAAEVDSVTPQAKSIVSLEGFVGTSAERDLTQDPLGEWLDVNADKMRLYVDGQANSEKPKQFTPPSGINSTMDPALQVAAVIDDLGYNDRCNGFADEKGLGLDNYP